MFKFDGQTEGFKLILYHIKENAFTTGKGEYLTHKEVRAYARCLLAVLCELRISSGIKAQINLLLASLSTGGLAHYDRSFLASQMLNLLRKDEEEDNSTNGTFF